MPTPRTLILAAILVLAACSDDDKNDGNNQPTPDLGKAAGTEGGPCYGNKTCNKGLVCLSDLCVRPADAGGGKKDGKVVKKDGPAVKKDGPAVKKDGPVTKPDGPVPDSAPPKPCTKGCVMTLAGSGKAGLKDGSSLQAQLKAPSGVALDLSGVLYIADRHNHVIRKLNKGVLSTLAGTGTKGYKNGAVSVAQFNEPYDLEMGPKNTLYVVERGNHTVRAISNGIVTTVAGTGKNGFLDGPLATAKLNYPTGISLSSGGGVHLADKSNNRIRLVTGGKLTTFAGTGTPGLLNGPMLTARFKSPYDIALGGPTMAYVADGANNVIRLISAGKVTTLAGDGVAGFQDGTATAARFSGPGSVAAGSVGKVYVSDYGNQRIRVIAGGQVMTLAGSGLKGYADDKLAKAKFNNPMGIVVNSNGWVYVADAGNHRIRLVIP